MACPLEISGCELDAIIWALWVELFTPKFSVYRPVRVLNWLCLDKEALVLMRLADVLSWLIEAFVVGCVTLLGLESFREFLTAMSALL